MQLLEAFFSVKFISPNIVELQDEIAMNLKLILIKNAGQYKAKKCGWYDHHPQIN
jgi:hypothetical protein